MACTVCRIVVAPSCSTISPLDQSKSLRVEQTQHRLYQRIIGWVAPVAPHETLCRIAGQCRQKQRGQLLRQQIRPYFPSIGMPAQLRGKPSNQSIGLLVVVERTG